MRIIPLFSSSAGNCTYIEYGGRAVLVDCGVTFKRLKAAFAVFDLDFRNVAAVVITHEHGDHVKGLEYLTKSFGIPVYASDGTARALCHAADVLPLSELAGIACDLAVNAFPTPHDTPQSVGYTFTYGDIGTRQKIAVCTDCGHVTDDMRENLSGSRAVLIESNYDPFLLKTGNYPYVLKKRILSERGHLSNEDSARFTAYLASTGTTRFILGHLSERNNTPGKAYQAHISSFAEAGFIENRDFILDVAPVENTSYTFNI